MRYSIKSSILHILDLFPKPVGEALYHKLQRQNGLLSNIESRVEKVDYTLSYFESELGKLNKTISGSTILELGAGFVPLLSYQAIKKYKARTVTIYDIRERLSKNAIRTVNEKFKTGLDTPYSLISEIKYVHGKPY